MSLLCLCNGQCVLHHHQFKVVLFFSVYFMLPVLCVCVFQYALDLLTWSKLFRPETGKELYLFLSPSVCTAFSCLHLDHLLFANIVTLLRNTGCMSSLRLKFLQTSY